jgi:LEA14-like dessication related protein
MRSQIQLFLILLISVSLFSCGSIKPLDVKKIENVKLNNFSKNSASFDITLKVENPNGYRFKLVDNNLDLVINQIELGQAKIKNRVVIPRKSEQSYTFTVEANFSRLAIASIPSLINMLKSKEVEMKLKGDVRVRTMGIGKTIPIEIVEKVNLSKN